jgi:2,3-dihydroxybenzoate-AMP ligase
VTHIKVVPALLIRLINDPAIANFKLDSVRQIQSGGQRMQPEVRLRTRELFRNAFVQENFGMSEGLLMFVRAGDPTRCSWKPAAARCAPTTR